MGVVQPIVELNEPSADAPEPIESTLLDLVRSVSEVTHDDREVVATVRHMIRSGRVRLCGIFRDFPAADF
ncbi:MAG: hypothetical protein ACQGVK_22690 [Myxococcota bacterium]